MRIAIAVVIFLAGCADPVAPQRYPSLNQNLMTKPCQFQPAEKDSDADLNADVQNMACGRKLRLQVYQLQDWIRNATTPL